MIASRTEQGGPVTTDGVIALANLHTQIEGSAAAINRLLAANAGLTPEDPHFVGRVGALIDLLELHGHVAGRVADYERAHELGEMLVKVAPRNGVALMARARTRATLHRFAAALADLDAAELTGVNKSELTAERLGVLGGLGRYNDAESLLRDAGPLQISALTVHRAVMHAERGQLEEADDLFNEARRSYRGVSPFPLARIDFQQGVMWHRKAALQTAQSCYEDALRLIPQYAPALGHLAEVEIHLGKPETAATRLRRLVGTSDDPDYAALFATALTACGERSEAQTWREGAATRYDELVSRHPEAYAHHAAHFWLTEGGDCEKGRRLALQNLQYSQTPRDHALHRRAVSACAGRSGSAASSLGEPAANSNRHP